MILATSVTNLSYRECTHSPGTEARSHSEIMGDGTIVWGRLVVGAGRQQNPTGQVGRRSSGIPYVAFQPDGLGKEEKAWPNTLA